MPRQPVTDEEILGQLYQQLQDPDRNPVFQSELDREIKLVEGRIKSAGKTPPPRPSAVTAVSDKGRDFENKNSGDILDQLGINLEPQKAAAKGDILDELGIELDVSKPEVPAGEVSATGHSQLSPPQAPLGEPPVRSATIGSLPSRFMAGGKRSVADASFAWNEIGEAKLTQAKEIVQKIKDGYKPTRQELSAMGPVAEHYGLKAVNDADKALAELEEGITAARADAAIADMVSSSYAQDIKEATPTDENFVEKALGTVAESGASTALGLAAAPLGAGAVVAAGSIAGGAAAFAGSYRNSTDYARAKGIEIPPEKKAAIATIDAFIEGAGSLVSLGQIVKMGQPAIRHLLKSIGVEASTEAVQEIGQKANEFLQYNPEMTTEEFLYDIALAGTAGAFGGGFIGGAVQGASTVKGKIDEARHEQAVNRAVDELINSESPNLLSPEEEARRALDPNLHGRPLQTPMEAFEAMIREGKADRAVELIQGMGDERAEAYGRVAKLYQDGDLSSTDYLKFIRKLMESVAEQVTVGRSELAANEAERQELLARFTQLAEQQDYTPSEDELKELQVAELIVQKTAMMKDMDDVTAFLMNNVPDTPVGRVLKHMLLSSDNISDYEKSDIDKTAGFEPNFMAKYYAVMAARQAGGEYPFAGSAIDGIELGAENKISVWRDAAGNEVDFHKSRGKALWASVIPEKGQRMAGLLDEWIKTLFPDATVGVMDREHATRVSDPKKLGGYQLPTGPDSAVIFVEQTANEAQDVEVLAHEFGHFIGNKLLDKMPPQVKAALRREWAKHARQMMKTRVNDAMRLQRGPAGVESTGSSENFRHLLMNRFYRGYLYSFEEWKAHQMERLVTSGKLDLNKPAQSFFKKYLSHLRRFFDKFGDSWNPSQTFEDFVKLGALRAKDIAIQQQQFAQAASILEGFGMEFNKPDGLVSVELKKALTKVNASQQLKTALDSASPEVQTEALQAMHQLGAAETSMFTPTDNINHPTIEMTAEEYTVTLQDAYIPGQTQATFSQLAAGQTPSSKPASRLKSAFRNYFRHSSRWRGRWGQDQSQYEGHLDKFTWFKKITYSLEQWAKLNPHIEHLQKYVEGVRSWHRDKMAWISRADERVRQWSSLTNEEKQNLGRFLLDQTNEGKFLDLKDPVVAAKYKLSPRAIEIADRIKLDFQDFITAIEATLQAQAVKHLAGNTFGVAAELKRIKERFDALRTKPYFPLSRFGEWTIVVRATGNMNVKGKLYKPGEVVHFEAFDTELGQLAELDRIKGAYPNAEVKLDRINEAVRPFMGMPTALIEALKANPAVNLTPEQKKAIDEYMYQIAPGQSFVKHLMQRKGVEGYTEDVLRSYSNYFFHGANHLARLKYSGELSEILVNMRVTADLITTNASKRRLIADYMARHFDYIMSPENDWANFRSVVAITYLAGMLRTAYVNLTQVPMVTYPHLAAKFGDGKALRALQQAYQDSWAAYRATRPMTKAEEDALNRYQQGLPPQPGDDKLIKHYSKFSRNELEMLKQGVHESWLDESQAMELAAMSEGSWLTRFKTTSKAGYLWRSFSHYSMVPFQAAEKLNRRVTALSAYRLAVESGANHQTAVAAAREAVSATQYNYQKWNRPELLRGKKGIFFMFWQYGLNTLFFATGGDKGWWRWWLMMLGVAGPLGLPFAENFTDLATWIGTKLKGDRFNAKYEMRKAAEELAEAIHVSPDLLLHGISRFGFGMIPFADMSGSMSMGKPFSPINLVTEHLAAPPGQKFPETVGRSVADAGGASTALVMRTLQAVVQEEADLFRRVERGMPISFAQQMMTAYRWWDRGAAETMSGADFTKFDTNDPWHLAELAFKGLGFQPRRVTGAREDTMLVQDFVKYYQGRRAMLQGKLDFEMEHGDTDSIQDVIEAIRRYNQSVPNGALAITSEDIARSRRARAKNRLLLENQQNPQKMYRPLENQVRDRDL